MRVGKSVFPKIVLKIGHVICCLKEVINSICIFQRRNHELSWMKMRLIQAAIKLSYERIEIQGLHFIDNLCIYTKIISTIFSMVSQIKGKNNCKPQNKYFHPLYHSQAITPSNQHLVPEIRK